MASKMICYPEVRNRMNDLGTPKSRVAEYLGISTSSLDNKLSGRTEFKFSEITRLSEWWGTPLETLASGAFEIPHEK